MPEWTQAELLVMRLLEDLKDGQLVRDAKLDALALKVETAINQIKLNDTKVEVSYAVSNTKLAIIIGIAALIASAGVSAFFAWALKGH